MQANLPVTISTNDVIIRLVVAAIAGAAVGLNRNLKGKPAGLRTHALVAMGSALAIVMSVEAGGIESGNMLHVLQGVVSGIGFLGAGVILHGAQEKDVHGLTTAASLWVVACIGCAAGAGAWAALTACVGITLAILILGGPIESFARNFQSKRGKGTPVQDD